MNERKIVIVFLSLLAAGCGKELHWYPTCGYPVCNLPADLGTPPDLAGTPPPPCVVSDVCTIEDSICDPNPGIDSCGVVRVCTTEPTDYAQCPVSRRRFKKDISYLDDQRLAEIRAQLLAVRLATYHYKHDDARERLGFLIDDVGDIAASDAAHDVVDLYGYTSMAVATIQLQAKQIDALQRRVDELAMRAGPSPRPRRSSSH